MKSFIVRLAGALGLIVAIAGPVMAPVASKFHQKILHPWQQTLHPRRRVALPDFWGRWSLLRRVPPKRW